MPLKPEHKATIDKFTSTDHTGNPIDKTKLLRANPMIARALAARAATLSDEERQAISSLITAQTAPAVKKLLPELSQLLNKK